MAILTGVAIFYFLMPTIYSADGGELEAAQLREAKVFLASAEERSSDRSYSRDFDDENVVFEPFDFNPNGLEKEDWMKLGLTEKQATLVKKYESKGGHFEVKSDVLKLYPVDSALFQKLEPYILLPNEKKQWESRSEEVTFEPFEFDPNGLPVEKWMKLGLSKKQAKSVKRYESSGGNFQVKSDVLNLWQVDEELYEKLKPYILLPDQESAKHWEEEPEQIVFEPFEFDPNGLPVEQWTKLGLTRKQAESIKRYEASGGHFEVKRDVLKLWQIDDELYEKLKPYILLPESFERDFERYKEKTELVKIEINSADTAALKKVRGIGSFYASAIVEYRKELGGFYSLDQLIELYNADEEKVSNWQSQLELDPSKIEKMDINTALAEKLRDHPYLEWKHANAIVNYREQHGAYESISDILKIAIIDNARFQKIKPYLSIDE
jgi:competence ComEA-like helix-hairpin-helix protein